MNENIYAIALGGLLHDIGKFMQRAELEKKHDKINDNYDEFCPVVDGGRHGYLHAAHTAYFIEEFMQETIINTAIKAELYNAARHHKNSPGDIYREADHLSAGMERYLDEPDSQDYKKVLLHSIFDSIELQYAIRDKNGRLNSRWSYRMAEFSENCDLLYPVMRDESGSMFDKGLTYKELWDKFKAELETINDNRNLTAYFNSLYWLIEKYTWCIPSATNAYPDISLFDHLKTTASIASCFYYKNQEMDKKKPEFILYAGDISGIQDYIFKISQSQGIGGISKRLRGRSFYIAMLSEVLCRHIISKLGLTIANVNYCGGGNFELLLPNTKSVIEFLDNLTKEISDWLAKEFHGSLGYVDARVEITAGELKESYGEKKDELADKLQQAKLRKNQLQIHQDSFWIDKTETAGKITICPSCNLKQIHDQETICIFCQQDKQIGERLPSAAYLIFSQSDIFQNEERLSIAFDKFGAVILAEENSNPMQFSDNINAIYTLSNESAVSLPRYFLAQTLPVAWNEMKLETEKDEFNDGTVYPGQTLSFSTLADMG
jgi:CRISPR-associated protein Csm1